MSEKEANEFFFPLVHLGIAKRAIRRVRELHNPVQLDPEWGEHCEHCDQDFPCVTIKALDGETE